MALEKLGDSLKNTFGKIRSAIFIDEKLVNEIVRDIQRALLASDANVRLIFTLTSEIKNRILSRCDLIVKQRTQFSIALARTKTSQCAFPVIAVKAEGKTIISAPCKTS